MSVKGCSYNPLDYDVCYPTCRFRAKGSLFHIPANRYNSKGKIPLDVYVILTYAVFCCHINSEYMLFSEYYVI